MASDKLWNAITHNNLKEIHQILSTGDIDLNKPYHGRSQTKGTFLQQACVSGSPVVVCALVKAGANVNACSIYKGHYYEFSVTALILAVIQRKVDLVEKLLHQCGADVNVTNDEGLAPLHFITEIIFSVGQQAGPLEKYGRTFQHGAPHPVIDKKIANLLLTAGATVDLKNKDGQTPLHFAAMESRKGSVTVDILLQNGARADIQDGNGMTPLHNALEVRNEATVQCLLQHGATTNIQNREKMTPLHLAVEKNAHATVQLLLQHGAKSNIQNSRGMTPLHFAAEARNVTTAKILLQSHAKVDIPTHEGLTPLHVAINAHFAEMFKLLIQQIGSNNAAVVNHAANDGTTPLHAVIEQCKYTSLWMVDETATIVKLLIEKGANLEVKKDHLTPLHLAVDGNLLNIVKLLVEAGADIHAETPNTGLTPLDMAEHGGHKDIIDYLTARLESHGKKK
ncbi:ankyrin-1-like [Branchiostoma floridae]|uniref:Ankyrin-1-like n=1 Tax=Branchiostoma floridae TaxID=7739 RepID=A0A9J7HM01_BRAFL|nr:ankyrin-1-like [Branchiostoma floridae]